MSQKQRAEQRPAAPPPPPSHPASQVVAVCSPHARISEEQRTRWLHFPGVPKPSLGDWAPAACPGVHQPRRSQHSPQLCSTDGSCLPAVSPVCAEGRGGGGQSIRSGLCCLIPMGLPWCRSLTSEPQFPCFHESRSMVPAPPSSQICGCFLMAHGFESALHTPRHLTGVVGTVGDPVPSGMLVRADLSRGCPAHPGFSTESLTSWETPPSWANQDGWSPCQYTLASFH